MFVASGRRLLCAACSASFVARPHSWRKTPNLKPPVEPEFAVFKQVVSHMAMNVALGDNQENKKAILEVGSTGGLHPGDVPCAHAVPSIALMDK